MRRYTINNYAGTEGINQNYLGLARLYAHLLCNSVLYSTSVFCVAILAEGAFVTNPPCPSTFYVHCLQLLRTAKSSHAFSLCITSSGAFVEVFTPLDPLDKFFNLKAK